MEFLTPGFEDMELSTQILIKEALVRGARVEVLDRSDNFILIEKDGHREYVKQATRTSADSYVAALAMENKEVSKILMSRSGLRVPAGSLRNDAASALEAASAFADRAFVIKPRSTNFGDGVTLLGPAWKRPEAEAAIAAALALDSGVIVEEFIAGPEYRFLVIGGTTRAVLHRRPANVVGDGVSTVRELIAKKNGHPYRGEGYHSPLEKLRLGDLELAFLSAAGLGPEAVVESGNRVFLRKNSNISTGGDSIDFTDAMPEAYKRYAERAAAAVGARIAGVDMIVADESARADGDGYAIIELNYNPALHIHDFPAEGANRRVEDHVLDLLGFPSGHGPSAVPEARP